MAIENYMLEKVYFQDILNDFLSEELEELLFKHILRYMTIQ